jgi:hypothetical protein
MSSCCVSNDANGLVCNKNIFIDEEKSREWQYEYMEHCASAFGALSHPQRTILLGFTKRTGHRDVLTVL